MSPIGRIFIVLNLILSAAFVGWAVSNLSSADDLQQQLSDKEAELAQVTADKDEEIGRLVSEKSDFEERSGEFREERDRLKEEAERVKNDLSKLQLDYDGLKAQIDSINSSLESYAETSQAHSQARADAEEIARTAEASREAAEGERDDAQEAAAEAAEALASLQRDMQAAQQTIASITKERDDLDTKLEMFTAYTGVSISELISQPDIDAYVLQVAPIEGGMTLVSLNKGTNDGVRKGYTFSVFNNGRYKGDVRVESVQDNQCSAVLVRSVDGQDISAGDNASTQI